MVVQDPVASAIAVMEAHLDGLNRRDEVALANSLHFPHYRLAEGELKTWLGPDDYFADFRARAGKDWGYTRWGKIEPLQVSETKVHLHVQVDRYRPDGTLLTSFQSLWVIACINGRWAAQLRSTFAPDSRFIQGNETADS